MASEKSVGGLKCFEVLARLSDYVDGELAPADKQQVDAHLAGCDACTRFGGEFGAVVKGLRRALGVGGDVSDASAKKLAAALRGKK